MSIDEFCSTNSSSETLKSNSTAFGNVRLHTRSHFDQVKARSMDRARALQQQRHSEKHYNFVPPVSNIDVNTSKNSQMRTLNKEVIAEMDRQYDHNVCLDRFIKDIKQHKQQGEPTSAVSDLIDDDSTKLSVVRNTKINKSNGCNCSNSSGSCVSCSSGCSSVAPRSNDETDSVSRNSSSVKSSTHENGKQDGIGSPELKVDSNSFKPIVSNNTERTESPPDELKNKNDETESGIETNFSSGPNRGNNSSASSSLKKYKGGKPGRKRKRGYIYDPKPVKGKPPKKKILDSNKDDAYWEKRKRNNEAAKRSRQMRRRKEVEVTERLNSLKKENEGLRVAIALLIKRNETLEFVLSDYTERSMFNTTVAKRIPVTS